MEFRERFSDEDACFEYLAYLDEFVFRFNRREPPMAAFQTLLGVTIAKN